MHRLAYEFQVHRSNSLFLSLTAHACKWVIPNVSETRIVTITRSLSTKMDPRALTAAVNTKTLKKVLLMVATLFVIQCFANNSSNFIIVCCFLELFVAKIG